MADARRRDADADLVPARCIEGDFLDADRLVPLMADGGLHCPDVSHGCSSGNVRGAAPSSAARRLTCALASNCTSEGSGSLLRVAAASR